MWAAGRATARPAAWSGLFLALPHLAATQQREADVAVHVELLPTLEHAQLDLVGLAVVRVEDLAAVPHVTVAGDAPHDGHALDRLVLALTVALAADRVRAVVRLQHLEHLGLQFAVLFGDLHDRLG